MPRPYGEELAYAQTEDGFLLAGAVLRPEGGPTQPVAIVLVHGNAGAFYDRPYVLIGRELASLGYPCVSGNTRGHDISATLWRASGEMPTGGGAGWERLEESPYDLAAWVEVAAGLGAGRVVLVGHSAGIQKVVLYMAERQDPRVAGIVFASPDLRGFRLPGELEMAERMVAEGQGLEVLPAQPFAPWYRQCAQTLVSRTAILARLFDPEGGTPALASIPVAMLAFIGTREPGGEAVLATIRTMAAAAPSVKTHLIEDADHFYTGHEPEVARVIAEWVATLPPR